jgi:hypothetical protein
MIKRKLIQYILFHVARPCDLLHPILNLTLANAGNNRWISTGDKLPFILFG